MDTVAETDRCLQSFFAGRLAFDKLVIALKSLRAGGDPHGAIAERLQYWVDLGRLPGDLKAHLTAELGMAGPAAGPAATYDVLDQPTVPQALRPVAAMPPAAPVAAPPVLSPILSSAMPPAAGSVAPPVLPPARPVAAMPGQDMALPRGDTMRDKVDEVVVNALIGGFTGMRGRGRETGQRSDAALDANLADFRSLRFRRDATNAEAGRARRFELDPRQEVKAIGAGAMLKDRFILDSEIGRGGMGVVYRAVDRRRLEAMHRQPYVAIKLLSGDFRRHPDSLRTLEAETRKAQELAHPNIITVHDFERDGGHLFIVMELLEGQPLDRLLAGQQGGGLPPAATETIIGGLCAGLAHAHDRGVIHADLKPANVFASPKLEVKLLDFGIASATREGDFDPASLGGMTLPYASPGMLEGAPRDPRDDVYALGCVVYLLITGRHPFDQEPALDAREKGLAPQRPPGLSDGAWAVLAASLSFDATACPPNAGAFQRGFFATPPFLP